MNIEALRIGMQVRHPQYGTGTVHSISEKTAEIHFSDSTRTVDPTLSEISPAEPIAAVSGLSVSLREFVDSSVQSVLDKLGYENPNAASPLLGARWQKGKLVLHPADPTLQTKEVPLEVFFHKIVGLRNQLRVLEQKVNSHPTLADADKVEMQQYITRCYGSLTTFNVLFKEKEDQF